MSSIADSDALLDSQRVLPQHQAALTLLQQRVANPHCARVRWLDLACGRGQIIVDLERNLSSEARSKIEYCGYDVNETFARETRKIADRLGMASVSITIGHLNDFTKLFPPSTLFDFITLTNTVHEVLPEDLAAVLVQCLLRINDNGTLFVYDMERVRVGCINPSRSMVASGGDRLVLVNESSQPIPTENRLDRTPRRGEVPGR
jgi:SAM-dependent methyltransferase